MSDYNSIFLPPNSNSNSISKNQNNNDNLSANQNIIEPKVQKILTRKPNNNNINNSSSLNNNNNSQLISPNNNSEVVSKQLNYLRARSKYFNEEIQQDHDTIFAESTIDDDIIYDPNTMILIGNNKPPTTFDELLDIQDNINKQQQFIVKLKQPKVSKIKEEEREEYSRNVPAVNYNNPSLYNRSSYPGYGGNNNQSANSNSITSGANNNFISSRLQNLNCKSSRTNYNNNSASDTFLSNQSNNSYSNNNSDNSSIQTTTWSKVATTNQPFSSFQTPSKNLLKEKSITFTVKLEGFGLSVPMWDVDMILNPVKESGGKLDFTNYTKDKYVLATFCSYSDTEKALSRIKGLNIRTTILS